MNPKTMIDTELLQHTDDGVLDDILIDLSSQIEDELIQHDMAATCANCDTGSSSSCGCGNCDSGACSC